MAAVAQVNTCAKWVTYNMKYQQRGMNLLVLSVSTVFALVLSEAFARVALNASDYLSVEMVQDEVLGAVPSARTKNGGFDAWGFRNRLVPVSADVVAIGDSHTYGNTATMEDSWPYVFGRLSNQRAYNMALGGYGPNQYYHLLQTRAISLRPTTVILGLYLGDDFENAFLITYGLQHWAYLRTMPADKVNFDIWGNPPVLTWHKKIRVWLSGHSVLYQILLHSSLMGRFQGDIKIKTAHKIYDSAIYLSVPEENILEAFLPQAILPRIDQRNENVREGMRITFKLLTEMSDLSKKNAIQFLVAVIPTKEMVFAKYLERNSRLPLGDVVDNLLANERLARERTIEFLTTSKIAYVDTLPALRHALSRELYARSATDMHPNRNGYKVIAETIWETLKQKKVEDRQTEGRHDTNGQHRPHGIFVNPIAPPSD